MNKKIISYAIPCYNSAAYMDHCIQSILDSAKDYLDDIEIIIVDDGSIKDNTAAIADEWAERIPHILKVVHQENGGHGQAVNTGLMHATGIYFKVVDSDDWVDYKAGQEMLETLSRFVQMEDPVDMVVCNYVYERVSEGTSQTMNYAGIFPERQITKWADVGRFGVSEYLLMHSVFYRTQLLKDIRLVLPAHTFYVDNIFVYAPLPAVKTIYYLNVDLYRYFIGREDQSVNESVMIGRIDQQLRVTRIMIDAHDLTPGLIDERLRKYMVNYLCMMMTICSVFLLLSELPDKIEQRAQIWEYLKEHNPSAYKDIRKTFLGRGCRLPGIVGRKGTIIGYHMAQKLFNFN
jgi:glycosyltransferase involved in cell wall biosynthesis